jgi:hypothetical protein
VPFRQDTLREILIVEQTDPLLRRRWFQSDYFDIFTWQDAQGAVTRFQLCYDVERDERALVWSRTDGFYHDGVDEGQSPGGIGQTPIFVPAGKFDSGAVVPRFRRESETLPADLREFILAKIREHLVERRRRKAHRRRVRREAWQRRGAREN